MMIKVSVILQVPVLLSEKYESSKKIKSPIFDFVISTYWQTFIDFVWEKVPNSPIHKNYVSQ